MGLLNLKYCAANDYGGGNTHSKCPMLDFVGGDILAAVNCGTVP
jgi:hypothetical protein